MSAALRDLALGRRLRITRVAMAPLRPDDAILWYTRLLDTWRDCDAELIGLRRAIEERRDALLARREA